ncbi:MAG TPA: hypothetical protein VF789_10300 [Thermoanaerobaculia bacterium]
MGAYKDFFRAFKAYNNYEVYVLSLGDEVVALWVQEETEDAARLSEARKGRTSIGGPYTARLDRPVPPETRADLHVFAKNRELFAMYSDGTRKHGKAGLRIPNRVAAGIRQHFPDFIIPDDQILEVTEEPGLPRITEG